MRLPIYLLALALFVAACSSNEPTSPTENGITVPGVGSTFEFTGYSTDLSGSKIAGTDTSYIQTVVGSGISFDGRTGVWVVDTKPTASSEATDTTYMCLDSKKDVLVFFPDLSPDGSPKWLRLPVTTGVASLDSISSTEDVNGVPFEVKFVVKTERIGDASISVGTSNVATKKIQMTVTASIVVMGQQLQGFETKQFLWFAPSLGTFVQLSSEAYDAGGGVQDGEFAKLSKYTLK